MKKIKVNEFQNIFYFIWDNQEETINMVNEYLKTIKGDNWSCGRCWDENTKSNTSDTLFISTKDGTFTDSSFYSIGEYVVDFINCFWGLSQEKFDKGDFIENWKELKK